MWSVDRARSAAWDNAEILSHLAGTPWAADLFLSNLDRTIGFVGRGLLVRT
jgi:hypothetical protein